MAWIDQEPDVTSDALEQATDDIPAAAASLQADPEENGDAVLRVMLGASIAAILRALDAAGVGGSAGPFMSNFGDVTGAAAGSLSERPEFGNIGRLWVAVDAGNEGIWWDAGTSWIQVSGGGGTGGEETDPVFSASPAVGITSDDLEDWATAFSWGDHGAAGYLTTAAFGEMPAAGITATQVTNWDTAHGWGNHADAGYLTAEEDPVFTSHAAYGVTAELIEDWNDAFSWGNHADAGYAAGDHNHDLAYAPLSHGHDAADVAVDADGFSGNLSTADDTVQKALATLDAMDLGGGTAPEPGTITRDGEGYIASVTMTTKTIVVGRSGGYIETVNDGTTLWTFTRDGDGRIASWTVGAAP